MGVLVALHPHEKDNAMTVHVALHPSTGADRCSPSLPSSSPAETDGRVRSDVPTATSSPKEADER